MKTLSLGAGWLVAGAITVLAWAGPAAAGAPPVVQLPSPGTLTMLSTGIALAVLGARWLRRK